MLLDWCSENCLTLWCTEAGITVDRSKLIMFLVWEERGEIVNVSKQEFFGFHTSAE